MSRLMKWVRGTLAGHVTWCIALCATPMVLFFAVKRYQSGALTPSWLLRQIAYEVLIWGLFGLVTWYFINRRRRAGKE